MMYNAFPEYDLTLPPGPRDHNIVYVDFTFSRTLPVPEEQTMHWVQDLGNRVRTVRGQGYDPFTASFRSHVAQVDELPPWHPVACAPSSPLCTTQAPLRVGPRARALQELPRLVPRPLSRSQVRREQEDSRCFLDRCHGRMPSPPYKNMNQPPPPPGDPTKPKIPKQKEGWKYGDVLVFDKGSRSPSLETIISKMVATPTELDDILDERQRTTGVREFERKGENILLGPNKIHPETWQKLQQPLLLLRL